MALADLATLVACAPLATLMVLQMLLLVVCQIIVYVWQSIGSSNFFIKLDQEYEMNKQLIQS